MNGGRLETIGARCLTELCMVFAVLLVGCYQVGSEHITFYIKPSEGMEAKLREIAYSVADRHEMHVTVRDLTYGKEVEPMFRATSSRFATWFGPSSTEPEFTIDFAFEFFEVTVYYPMEYQRERVLISQLRSELENSSIQFSTEFPEELRSGSGHPQP